MSTRRFAVFFAVSLPGAAILVWLIVNFGGKSL